MDAKNDEKQILILKVKTICYLFIHANNWKNILCLSFIVNLKKMSFFRTAFVIIIVL